MAIKLPPSPGVIIDQAPFTTTNKTETPGVIFAPGDMFYLNKVDLECNKYNQYASDGNVSNGVQPGVIQVKKSRNVGSTTNTLNGILQARPSVDFKINPWFKLPVGTVLMCLEVKNNTQASWAAPASEVKINPSNTLFSEIYGDQWRSAKFIINVLPEYEDDQTQIGYSFNWNKPSTPTPKVGDIVWLDISRFKRVVYQKANSGFLDGDRNIESMESCLDYYNEFTMADQEALVKKTKEDIAWRNEDYKKYLITLAKTMVTKGPLPVPTNYPTSGNKIVVSKQQSAPITDIKIEMKISKERKSNVSSTGNEIKWDIGKKT